MYKLHWDCVSNEMYYNTECLIARSSFKEDICISGNNDSVIKMF